MLELLKDIDLTHQVCHDLLLLYLLSCLHMSAANIGTITGIGVQLCVLITANRPTRFWHNFFFLALSISIYLTELYMILTLPVFPSRSKDFLM